MTLRSQPSEGCASASFATSAHQITRNIAGTVSTRNGKPRGLRPAELLEAKPFFNNLLGHDNHRVVRPISNQGDWLACHQRQQLIVVQLLEQFVRRKRLDKRDRRGGHGNRRNQSRPRLHHHARRQWPRLYEIDGWQGEYDGTRFPHRLMRRRMLARQQPDCQRRQRNHDQQNPLRLTYVLSTPRLSERSLQDGLAEVCGHTVRQHVIEKSLNFLGLFHLSSASG